MPEEISAQELEQLLRMMTLPQPPYLLAGIGLLMAVLCGLTFGRQVQNKLDGWKQDRLPLLPLGTVEINLSYGGTLIGVTLLVALLLSLLTGGALFAQLERLMLQVEEGNFKAVDFDNFDEFF